MIDKKKQNQLFLKQAQLQDRQLQLIKIQTEIKRSHSHIGENNNSLSSENKKKKIKQLIGKTLNSLFEEGLVATVLKIRKKLLEIMTKNAIVTSNREVIHPLFLNTTEAITIETAKSPTVSLIIPVYNKYLYTFNCLKSIADTLNTYIDFEVIIIDDASTDETDTSLKIISGIRVFRNQDNRGFIKSCNYGASLAKGKFLCFLNNDTQILPGWLENLLLTLEKDESVGAVGSKLIYPDGKLQEAGGIIWQDASGWNYGRSNSPEEPEYNYVREVDYCSGASLLVKADLFKKIGGFSETFLPAYYEDTDLCFSLRKLGYKVLYQPKSQVIHYEGISSGTSIASGVKKYQEINKSKFQQKWQEELVKHFTPAAENAELGARRLGNKPTILVIDSYIPVYDRESGSCRLFRILKIFLSLGYSVIFLPDNGFPEDPYTSELQAMGIEVLYFTSQQPNLQKQLRKRLPLIQLAWICRPELCMKHMNFIRQNSTIPIIYDTIDLHFLRLKRQQQFLPQKPHDKSWETYKKLETKLARNVEATVVVTEVEKNTLNNLDISNVWVIPNIHTSFSGSFKKFEQRINLLFIGSYNHPPNVDAVLWLYREIMPFVWQSHPEIKLTLLGSNPPEEVKALENERVMVTGYVRDVEPYFLNSRVFVAPLRFGAGMKGKIGHSMSYALPTVTTSIGAEGMGLTHGYDVMIADEPDIFAKHILKVYDDCQLWNYISQNALDTLQKYSSENVEKKLQNLLENLVTAKRSTKLKQ